MGESSRARATFLDRWRRAATGAGDLNGGQSLRRVGGAGSLQAMAILCAGDTHNLGEGVDTPCGLRYRPVQAPLVVER
jgi:hypothetical protein